jgi:hypothetical protein
MGEAILLIRLILSDFPFSRGIAMLCLYHSVADIGLQTLRPEQHYMRIPHVGGELKPKGRRARGTGTPAAFHGNRQPAMIDNAT